MRGGQWSVEQGLAAQANPQQFGRGQFGQPCGQPRSVLRQPEGKQRHAGQSAVMLPGKGSCQSQQFGARGGCEAILQETDFEVGEIDLLEGQRRRIARFV